MKNRYQYFFFTGTKKKNIFQSKYPMNFYKNQIFSHIIVYYFFHLLGFLRIQQDLSLLLF